MLHPIILLFIDDLGTFFILEVEKYLYIRRGGKKYLYVRRGGKIYKHIRKSVRKGGTFLT